MSLAVAQKSEVIGKYRIHKSDSGSPEVQVALLSQRILQLTEHFKIPSKGSSLSARTPNHGGPPSQDAQVSKRSQPGTVPRF